MNKLIIFLIGFCAIIKVNAQDSKVHKSFENLSEIKIPNFDLSSLKYDPSITLVIAKQYGDLDAEFKNEFFPDYACDAETWIMLKIKLNRNVDKYYYITFGICPEVEFYIYEEGNNMPIGNLYALNLVIPGNGAIYSSGHMGNFDVRRKFELSNDTIVEVKQPYYYVGLKSKTLRTVKIFKTKDCKETIATLPENYEIEVLLTNEAFTPDIYLVRTSFGLVGWAKLEAWQYMSKDVDGLFYNND